MEIKKIGIIGINDGNGHPYSMSAMFNGYNPKALRDLCPFKLIKELFKDTSFKIDEINKNHQISLAKFGIEYTNYYSTHSNENEALVSEIYLDAKSSGYIYKKEIEQCFDEEKQMFLADRYVIGDCPKCFAKNQYGDGLSLIHI